MPLYLALLTLYLPNQVLSHQAAHQVKHLGLQNDLIQRIAEHPYFDPIKPELAALLDPQSFVGRAPEQVDTFVREWAEPALGDLELRKVIEEGGKIRAELSV